MKKEKLFDSDYRLPAGIEGYEYRNDKTRLTAYQAVQIVSITVLSLISVIYAILISNGDVTSWVFNVLFNVAVTIFVLYMLIVAVSNILSSCYSSSRIAESLYSDKRPLSERAIAAENRHDVELHNLTVFKYVLITLAVMVSIVLYMYASVSGSMVRVERIMSSTISAVISVIGILAFIMASKYYSRMACNCEKILSYLDDEKKQSAREVVDMQFENNQKLLSTYKIIFISLLVVNAVILSISSIVLEDKVGVVAMMSTCLSAVLSIIGIIVLVAFVGNIARVSYSSNKILDVIYNTREWGKIDFSTAENKYSKSNNQLSILQIVLFVLVGVGVILAIISAAVAKQMTESKNFVFTIISSILRSGIQVLGIIVFVSAARDIANTARNSSKILEMLKCGDEGKAALNTSSYQADNGSKLTIFKIITSILVGGGVISYIVDNIGGKEIAIINIFTVIVGAAITIFSIFIIADVLENVACTARNMKQIESAVGTIKKCEEPQIVTDAEDANLVDIDNATLNE